MPAKNKTAILSLPQWNDDDVVSIMQDFNPAFATLDSEVSKVSQLSNPNLLINSDFSVWQRGDSFEIPHYTYTADRWQCQTTNGDIPHNGIFRHPNGMELRLVPQAVRYKLEDNEFEKYKGKTVTISYSFENTIATQTIIINSKTIVDIIFPVGILNWIKAELGSVATPYIPPDPAVNLMQCQRYFQKGLVTFVYAGVGNYYHSVSNFITKRIIPTMQYTGNDGLPNSLNTITGGGTGTHITTIHSHIYDAGTIIVDKLPENSMMLITEYIADAEIY